MIPIRKALAALTLFAVAASAAASGERPYTANDFKQLTQAGQQVVVDVHADWCPTCRRQQPVLESLMKDGKYKDYTILVVDFDKQTDALKQFRVSSQSTLIVFHGTQEKARATGITTPQQIGALLDQGL